MSVVEGLNLLTPLMHTTARGAEVVAWTPWGLVYSAAWAILGLFISALIFHRSESAFAENV
jgi:ABC-type polysaccharide/polyol phosphate export permease